MRKLPTFRGDSSLATWLHRVAVNEALAFRRRRATRRNREVLETLAALEHENDKGPSHLQDPVDLAIAEETRERITRAAQQLPEPYREVFALSDLQELSNPEIAERLQISLSVVKSRLHRARSLLRESLGSSLAEMGV